MPRLTVIATLAVLLVAGCSSSGRPATPPVSPAPTSSTTAAPSAGDALLTRASQDATRAGSFHAEVSSVAAGITTTITQDSGLASGHQFVTQGGGHIEVEVLGSAVFLKSDAAGLAALLNIPSAEAARYAATWISVPTGDTIYPTVSQGVTLSSALTAVAPTGPVNVGPSTTINGTAAVGLTGQGTGPNGTTIPVTMFVSAGADPLPVEITASTSDGSTEKATFSNWGEPVDLTAPAGPISLSTIPGAP